MLNVFAIIGFGLLMWSATQWDVVYQQISNAWVLMTVVALFLALRFLEKTVREPINVVRVDFGYLAGFAGSLWAVFLVGRFGGGTPLMILATTAAIASIVEFIDVESYLRAEKARDEIG